MPRLRPTGNSAPGAGHSSSAAGSAPSGPPPRQPPSSSPALGGRHQPQHQQQFAAETPPVRRAPAPFPADVSPRGPPPAPPPSSHKPSLNAMATATTDSGPAPAAGRSRTGPPLPSKPPGVTRSASQSSLGGGAKRPLRAPAVKPPPPPKSPAVVTTAVASTASKFGTVAGSRLVVPNAAPPLARRQSFGAPDSRDGADLPGGPQLKPTGPPPPPRNVSVPSNLHQAHKVRSVPPAPPARGQAPVGRPPPPPRGQPPPLPTTAPPPLPTSGPPPLPTSAPPPLPTTAPPQLPQRGAPPQPPHQAAKPTALVAPSRPSPTPPQRSSSVRNSLSASSGFESRFRFRSIDDVPAPHYTETKEKRYPSKAATKQNHQRQAPLPPLSLHAASSGFVPHQTPV
ncbi:hypothetical protein V5799_009976 [Amblyomma americanum]|uniref:Uncharacterized protein n=1 Tax=Amblyomma americanum TaxID=6943 RepID=A0AAQ4F8W4_AMBAM